MVKMNERDLREMYLLAVNVCENSVLVLKSTINLNQIKNAEGGKKHTIELVSLGF